MNFNISPDFSIAVYDNISQINREVWQSVKPDMQFYQSYEFLQIIQDLHPQLHMRFALVYQNLSLRGIVYTQQMQFSYRHILNYTPSAGNFFTRTFKHFFSGKEVFLLNLGDVFFTGDKGILSANEAMLLPVMPEILNKINKTFTVNKSGAFLMANLTLNDESKCVFYRSKKYHPFSTEPDMYMYLDENWHTLQDYMDALTSKYRTRAKKVFSISADIICKTLSVEDAIKYKQEMSVLYNNVMDKTDFNLAKLNPDFFARVQQQYPLNCTLKGYFLEDKLVAFVCLFACNDRQLHVHYIGLNYEVNTSHKLYNRMLFDFVQFAIDNHFTKIHFGRTATEIKSTIGAQAMPLKAYLKMNNKIINMLLPALLRRIKPQPYTLRSPFK